MKDNVDRSIGHGDRNSSRRNTTMPKQGRLYQGASEVASMLVELAS